MMRSSVIAVVTRPTRLKGLVARWGTKGAAAFRLRLAQEHQAGRGNAVAGGSVKSRSRASAPDAVAAAAEFTEYEQEDAVYQSVVEQLRDDLDLGYPVAFVDRDFLPNYNFNGCAAVVVVGQDGLVANTAKYVGDIPIVAVNPDPRRIDGVLLPFGAADARRAVQRVLKGTAPLRNVTLAEANLNDGQRLLAFNDLFIGCSGHASARYVVRIGGRAEPQSSSGMIVSTGAGSTGWLSSTFNMYQGFAAWLQTTANPGIVLPWDDPRLAWVVREPFRSKQSATTLVAGFLEKGAEIVVESLMPSRGVIFSDGIESDFLEFNSSAIVRIRRSQQHARLVAR
jgi:hypothetical protein